MLLVINNVLHIIMCNTLLITSDILNVVTVAQWCVDIADQVDNVHRPSWPRVEWATELQEKFVRISTIIVFKFKRNGSSQTWGTFCPIPSSPTSVGREEGAAFCLEPAEYVATPTPPTQPYRATKSSMQLRVLQLQRSHNNNGFWLLCRWYSCQ